MLSQWREVTGETKVTAELGRVASLISSSDGASSALSLGKGLARPMREMTVFFSVLTTKLPLPGRTGLMETFFPFAFKTDSIAEAPI